MCGICGTVGLSDKNLIKEMTKALLHRGPDSEGFHIEDDAALGMRRLSVIDIEGGSQPMYNEKQTLCVIHNGEIYNFKELREGLLNRGHVFKSASDTEVIVHLYEEYGQDCVLHLDGMFAFAVWDIKNKELFIARDRIGIKPLYYHYHNGILRFASEVKSIIKDRNLTAKLNPKAIACFFAYLYIPSPYSIFEGINKLPPAHTLMFKKGKLDITPYWNISFRDDAKLPASKDIYGDISLNLLKDSVKKRLISDVPLGVFLSGGIDSSAIVALMRKINSSKIKTFSIGFDDKYSSFNELDYAQAVASRFETEHTKFIVTPDIVKILPKVAWHLDEPFADSSAILNFLIAEVSRKSITVALTGIGGDETFGGYPRYLGAKASLCYRKIPLALRKTIDKISSPFIKEGLTSANTGSRFKRFLHGTTLDLFSQYIHWMQFTGSLEQNNLFSGDMRNELKIFDLKSTHTAYMQQANSTEYLKQIYSLDIHTYLVDDLLFMADRMSMAHGLELRVPFCDHRLIDYCARIPENIKFSNFRLKSMLKKSLKNILPDEILQHKKQGFMAPIGRWLKEDLKDFTRDVISKENFKRMPFFNFAYADSLLNCHSLGKGNYTHQIWALLMFCLWHEQYMKNNQL
ncbi:MAG: asparagine synthase (glutamine-hydrolyzing) [Candidatus Omnitrophota bacterium]